MPITRQDAWSQDEDLLLAEVVLRHIREGSTQLQAFEEVGRQLSRTSAACGFRWNSFVRKQYKSGIDLAKKQRKELKKSASPVLMSNESVTKKSNEFVEESTSQLTGKDSKSSLTFDEVINYLQSIYQEAKKSMNHEEEIGAYDHKIQALEKQIYYLVAENEKLTKDIKMIESDYKALIEIMERARKMVVLQEEDRQQKVKFQMDKNGNLERVEK
ncbi:RsfA family transcriptional regulator [Bacillus massilinigeriensis]|uniref:RsfA family transcriptional regulator n=1 Tax=Bacillus massilionigeriensis TaxID=1805475 RepID=UPI00096B0E4C|nr:RsfA family transcriptional regulator [Bacillus massilionigeriensis]